MLGNDKNKSNNNFEYISLQEATKFCNYSQEYLSLRARTGKLKSVKLGRNWATTKEWLVEYANNVDEYNESINNNGHEKENAPKIARTKLSRSVKEKIVKDQIFHSPPENLPIIRSPKIKFNFGTLRPGFAAALVLVLLTAGGVFGKESIFKTYNEVARVAQNLAQNMAIVSDDVFTATANYRGALASLPDNLSDYGRWLKNNYSIANEKVEQKIGNTLLALAPEKAEKFVENTYRSISRSYSAADKAVEKKISEITMPKITVPDIGKKISDGLKIISAGYFAADKKVEQKIGNSLLSLKNVYSSADRSIEQKIAILAEDSIDGYSVARNYLGQKFAEASVAVSNFGKQKLAETKQSVKNFEIGFRTETMKLVLAVGEPFIKIYESIIEGFKFAILPWQGVVPGDFEELRTKMAQFEKEPVVIKRIEVSKVVEPVKEITRTLETVKQITKIDDAALAEVRANLVYLEGEIGKRLYAPGGVVSQTIYMSEPVSSPKIYQQNGEIVLQTLGSGNVILSAATGLQLYGQQVVIESTNLLNPLIYLASKTKIGGDTTINGATSIGGTLSVGSTLSSGAATVNGDLTVTGAVTLGGAQTLTGNLIVNGGTNSTFAGPIVVTTSTASQLKLAYDAADYTTFGTNSAGDLTITPSGGDVTIIGQIGIGTTTPRYKLDVWGDMAVGTSTGTNVPALYVDSGDGGRVGIGTTTVDGTLLTVGTTTPSLVVASNGYVGIGTASPAYQVDIWGGGSDARMQFLSGATAAEAIFQFGRTSRDGILGAIASDGAWADFGTAGDVVLRSDTNDLILAAYGSTNAIRLGTGNPNIERVTIVNSGNVGIATTSPRYKLDVWGDLATGTSTDTNTPLLYVDSGNGGQVGIGTTTLATNFLTIGTSTPLFVIASNGYIGIGTTTPESALTVVGNTSITGNIVTVSGNIMPSSPRTQDIGSAAYDWANIYVNNLYANNIGAGSSSISGTAMETFTINSDATADATSSLRFYRGSDTPHALLTWDADYDRFNFNFPLYLSGSGNLSALGALTLSSGGTSDIVLTPANNVGIATTTPRYKLDVWGDMAIGTSTNTNTPALYVDSGNGGRIGIGTTTLAGLLTVGTTTPFLVVAPNGYIGMGTSTPESPVHLVTDGPESMRMTRNGFGSVFSYLSSPVSGQIDYAVDFLQANSGISFYVRDAAKAQIAAMRIDKDGNVGIATTTPRYKLDVYGDVAFGTSSASYTGTISTPALYVHSGTGGQVGIGTTTLAGLLTVGTSTPALVVSPLSYVGIGTSTPSTNLAVAGDIMGSGNMVIYGTTATSTFTGGLTAGNNAALVVNQTAAANSLYVAANGYVGIGTATPGSKLSFGTGVLAGDTIRFYESGTNYYTVGVDGDNNLFRLTAGTSGGFAFYTGASGGIEKIRIDTNGNVGIGTNSPSQKLTVYGGNLAVTTGGTATTTISSGVSYFAGGLVSQASSTFAGNFSVGTSTTPALFVDSGNGYVGIGTASPTSLLTVAGDADITGDTISFGTAGPTLYVRSMSADLQFYVNGAGTMTIGDGNDDVSLDNNSFFVESDNGNVGIGNTVPSSKLTVNGGSLTVSTNGTATTTISSGVSYFAGGLVSQASSTFANNLELIGDLTISSSTGSLYQPVWGSDDGLVLYLPFSEGMTSSSASIAYDRSPYGNDGTATGMPMPTRNATSGESGWATTTCKVGSCMTFDGVNDYVDVADADSLSPGNAVTVMAWIKTTDTAGQIAGKLGATQEYSLYLDGGGGASEPAFFVNTGSLSFADSNTVIDTNWHYLVGTYDGTNIKIYVDGILKGTQAKTGTMSNTAMTFSIGRESGGASYLGGLIDEVRVYNRALSADEVRTHYLRGTNANGAVLADKFRVVGTDNNINLQINGSGSSYLNTGYSLGIATTTPRYTLDVWGDMAIGTSTGTNVPALYVQSGQGGRIGIGTTTLSGLLTVGTTTPALVVAPTGYVGIGTADPTRPLYIYGTNNTSIVKIEGDDHAILDIMGTADSEKSINFYTGASLAWKIGMDNEPAGDTNDFSIKQVNNGTPDFIVKTSGNVGIATSSPRYKLDVWGDMAIGTSTGTNIPALYVDSGEGGRIGIGTTTVTGTLLTVGTTTPALVVANNGYVGVGTTAPTQNLYVYGKIGMGNATYGDSGYIDIDNLNFTFYRADGADRKGIVARDLKLTANGSIFTTSDTDDYKIDFQARDNGVGLVTIATMQSAADPYFKAGNLTALYSGNVGIATTTPRYLLDVWGDMAIGTSTTSNGTTTPLLYVDSGNGAGKIGIATSSPRYSLDVWGSLAIGTSTGADLFYADTGNSQITIGGDISMGSIQVASSSGAITFADMVVEASAAAGTEESYSFQIDSSELFRIYTESNGSGGIQNRRVFTPITTNFGIGTSTPRYTLDVYGTMAVGTSSAGYTGASSTPALYVVSGTGGQVGIGTTTLSGTLLTVGTTTPALVVANNGYVGVGTTAPQDALHVIGDIRTSACASDGAGDVACVDVAESYFVGESLEAGDVVGVVANPNPSTSTPLYMLVKASGATLPIGVISTRPGLYLEGVAARFGGPKLPGVYESGDQAPVALVGRVPAKVSLENGPIAVGDPLTSSNVPGVAMKAVSAGRVIGFALEPYDGSAENNKILVFVNLSWKDNDLSVEQNSSGQIVNTEFQQGLAGLGLVVNEYGVLELGTLKTQQLCVGSVCVTESDFMRVFGASVAETLTTSADSVCTNGANQSCSSEIGACQIGVQVCEGGQWGACIGAVLPAVEICDSVDNDCDGVVDEGGVCDGLTTTTTTTDSIITTTTSSDISTTTATTTP